MSIGRFLQQAAAGNAGEAVYVDDVFSTYLYEGNSSTQTITNNIVLGDGLSGGDYTNVNGTHYLTKSGDLTGNTDGKSCTVSCWINTTDTSGTIISNTNSRFVVRVSSGKLNVYAKNTSDVNVLYFTTNLTIAIGKWVNVLFSFDLSSSSNRSVYINDVEDTSVTWSTYNNENIDRASTGTWYAGLSLTADLAHIFQSNSYTDLSVEANRRNFITSDKLPTSVSAVSALSPILYLPLTSDYTIGKNLGTGGDFTTSGAGVTSVNNGVFTAVEGKGGLVWIKQRNANNNHLLIDTERGATKTLFSNSYFQEVTYSTGLTSFNSDGFTLGTESSHNSSGINYASWTFRKQPGFFDVVTYTGTGSNQSIAHNLGSVPGMVIIKQRSGTEGWFVWHRSLGYTNNFYLNSPDGSVGNTTDLFTANPDSSNFYVGGSQAYATNQNGQTYVAYLFAHDAQEFGTNSNESIIKCGSYTGNGNSTTGQEINLGFEPQFVMIKGSDPFPATNWFMLDTMRGFPVSTSGADDPSLFANSTAAEASYQVGNPTSTGFKVHGSSDDTNGSQKLYIYMAIRRPHKPASEFAATDLFSMDAAGQTSNPAFVSNGHVVDMAFEKTPSSIGAPLFFSRLTGDKYLNSTSTAAEATGSSIFWDYMSGCLDGFGGASSYQAWMFRRAPGFFDVVAYTGTGSTRTVSHNLGVAPEMMIFKCRTNTNGWAVYHSYLGNTKVIILQSNGTPITNSAWFNNTTPTDSVFTVGSGSAVNQNTIPIISYHFASVSGISKVGSYSGTGSNVDVNCGFTSGARFVLVKRTDSTGDWYLWDSERGIVAGNDPYLFLNSTAAQVTSTDYIDPLSSGFTITSSAPAALNASGGTYIFLAIA